LIYSFLKQFVKLALRIFCPAIVYLPTQTRNLKGPLLICANHPNSFLDAMVLGCCFRAPVYFLARGDAFHKPWHGTLLRLLHMFPIYRMSEGKENMGLNTYAFEKSREVLRNNGILLIFIEGICVNKHQLQPFKKGAARIAYSCWKEGVPLKILPMGIAYDSFTEFGKKVNCNAGDIMHKSTLLVYEEEAQNYNHFNQQLLGAISSLIQIPTQKIVFPIWLQPFATIGKIIHHPLYRFIQKAVAKKTKNSVFYDSVLFGFLFFVYGIILLWLIFICWAINIPFFWTAILILILPTTAFAASLKKISTRDSSLN
jgi:1-acyl-sn-glycerol-3-phosphate acyltransferase